MIKISNVHVSYHILSFFFFSELSIKYSYLTRRPVMTDRYEQGVCMATWAKVVVAARQWWGKGVCSSSNWWWFFGLSGPNNPVVAATLWESDALG